MVDIVFAAVPYVDSTEPIMAPGYLKAIVENNGYRAIAMDLNAEVMEKSKKYDRNLVEELVNFHYSDCACSEQAAVATEEMVNYCAERILSYNSKIIGLSLLTYLSQRFTKFLLCRLKQLNPTVKIIIGGTGIKNFVADKKNDFCEELKQCGLIDHYILGDAENAIVEFLNGNLNYHGIDSEDWIQPTKLDQFPFPDYSDYNFDLYETKVIPIIDSQGCVRTCEFCDVIEHWKKYTYKPADYAFKEMLHQSQKHGIYKFSMRSSLTNGNLREFKKWVEMVAEYNQTHGTDKQFSWGGYFIVREGKQHPEELWEKIGLSQGTLILGVESVIEKVRWDLGKKFYNVDIDYHLEMGRKYQVPLVLLLIIASPTETLEDYEFTKQWIKDRIHYAKNSVITVITSFASILPGTEWYRKADDFQITLGDFPVFWSHQNLEITQEKKNAYWKEIVEICKPFNQDSFDPFKHQKGSISVIE